MAQAAYEFPVLGVGTPAAVPTDQRSVAYSAEAAVLDWALNHLPC